MFSVVCTSLCPRSSAVVRISTLDLMSLEAYVCRRLWTDLYCMPSFLQSEANLVLNVRGSKNGVEISLHLEIYASPGSPYSFWYFLKYWFSHDGMGILRSDALLLGGLTKS